MWLLDGFLKVFLQNISSQDEVLALFYVKASPATCQAGTSTQHKVLYPQNVDCKGFL